MRDMSCLDSSLQNNILSEPSRAARGIPRGCHHRVPLSIRESFLLRRCLTRLARLDSLLPTETESSITPTGQELYVRAKIVSSKLPAAPDSKGTPETAWAQPMIVGH